MTSVQIRSNNQQKQLWSDGVLEFMLNCNYFEYSFLLPAAP